MLTRPFMRRLAAILAMSHFLLLAQVPLAHAAMLGTAEVVAAQQQQVDRQQLLRMLEDQGSKKSWWHWALSRLKWNSVSTA
jgi:hypothetical protein